MNSPHLDPLELELELEFEPGQLLEELRRPERLVLGHDLRVALS